MVERTSNYPVVFDYSPDWLRYEHDLKDEIIEVVDGFKPRGLKEFWDQFRGKLTTRLSWEEQALYQLGELPGLLPQGGITSPLEYFEFYLRMTEISMLDSGVNGDERQKWKYGSFLGKFIKDAPRDFPSEKQEKGLKYCLEYASMVTTYAYLEILEGLSYEFAKKGESELWIKRAQIIEDNLNQHLKLFHHHEEEDKERISKPGMRLMRAVTRQAFGNWFAKRAEIYRRLALER